MTDAIKNLVDILNSDESGSPRVWHRQGKDYPYGDSSLFNRHDPLFYTEIHDAMVANSLAERQYGTGIASIGINTEVISHKAGTYKFVIDGKSMEKLKPHGVTFMIEAGSVSSAQSNAALAA